MCEQKSSTDSKHSLQNSHTKKGSSGNEEWATQILRAGPQETKSGRFKVYEQVRKRPVCCKVLPSLTFCGCERVLYVRSLTYDGA